MTAKNIVMAAAGAAGAAVLGVEDVFSTYLWDGNNVDRDIPNQIQLGGRATNGTILQLTGDTLTDSSPVPCGLTNNGVSVNTTTKKYGTGSLYYNGTTTNRMIAVSPDLRFGTGDFTVECWAYATSSVNQGLFQLGSDFTGAGNNVGVAMFPANQFQWGWDASYTGGVGSWSLNTWVHVALVRQSGVMKLYVNGTQVGSNNTYAGNINVGRVWVGNYYDGNYAFNGYIDDFRVSNKAVYTANFTPPAAALPIDTLVAGSNYGGMVWIKNRSDVQYHNLYDTVRGAGNYINSNTTGTQGNVSDALKSFNATGFTVGNNAYTNVGGMGYRYASWTFRRQPKFFDVVTWTGNGTTQTISHSLGATVGCVILKRITGGADDWYVWHRSATSGNYLKLNSTNAQSSSSAANIFGNNTTTVDPTSTNFTVGNIAGVNASGSTYVAYIFAHDAGGFGTSGTDNVISCGSYTGNGSGNQSVNLGWEPQWILVKNVTSGASYTDWWLFDNMRGWPVGTSTQKPFLRANTAGAESTTSGMVAPSATGFDIVGSSDLGQNGITYIYIAIRRGPMKTPTSGTSVFGALSRTGNSSTATLTSGFPVDATLIKSRSTSYRYSLSNRLVGAGYDLDTSATSAEYSTSTIGVTGYDSNTGISIGSGNSINDSTQTFINWFFRRAPGFMDVVCYTGNATNRTINHNLGVVPEMMIVKNRTNTGGFDWFVYHSALGNTKVLTLTSSGAVTIASAWNNTTPTASVFSVGTATNTNGNTNNIVAYLFASCPGVSKVGSFTQVAGVDTAVNCGFTSGARFILIKSTATTSNDDWYVWDSVRGITSGTDPYLRLNLTNLEVTSANAIVPNASGFSTSGSWWSAGTYIYLAIA